MKIKNIVNSRLIKQLVNKSKQWYLKGFVFLCLLSTYRLASANPLIPISNTDETQSGTDFSTTVITIIQKDILPLLEIGGAAFLLWKAFAGLWHGYKQYQENKDVTPLKTAVMASVIMIVVGGAILFMLDKLRTYQFS